MMLFASQNRTPSSSDHKSLIQRNKGLTVMWHNQPDEVKQAYQQRLEEASGPREAIKTLRFQPKRNQLIIANKLSNKATPERAKRLGFFFTKRKPSASPAVLLGSHGIHKFSSHKFGGKRKRELLFHKNLAMPTITLKQLRRRKKAKFVTPTLVTKTNDQHGKREKRQSNHGLENVPALRQLVAVRMTQLSRGLPPITDRFMQRYYHEQDIDEFNHNRSLRIAGLKRALGDDVINDRVNVFQLVQSQHQQQLGSNNTRKKKRPRLRVAAADEAIPTTTASKPRFVPRDSRFLGVYDYHGTRWRVLVCNRKGEPINLGIFSDDVEAAHVYDEYIRVEHKGAFPTNFDEHGNRNSRSDDVTTRESVGRVASPYDLFLESIKEKKKSGEKKNKAKPAAAGGGVRRRGRPRASQ